MVQVASLKDDTENSKGIKSKIVELHVTKCRKMAKSMISELLTNGLEFIHKSHQQINKLTIYGLFTVVR
jgi:hypothetical protein